ncbi:hypothetical protein SNE40_002841 [Patella caerulea]|uniref:Uncharacterized protein n=1 Tax=Patella caerulea TaxID=87958 RepID=A0AAN8K8K2_PATCE
MLERAQRHVVKLMLGLNSRTKTDICQGFIGWCSLESYISTQKLFFLGQLLNLSAHCLPHQICVNRLLEYRYNCCEQPRGFIAEVSKILKRYNLSNYIEDFIISRTFPNKVRWKKLVRDSVKLIETRKWLERIKHDEDMQLFSEIHPTLESHPIFSLWSSDPSLNNACSVFVKVCAYARINDPTSSDRLLCEHCGLFLTCNLSHAIVECVLFMQKRLDVMKLYSHEEATDNKFLVKMLSLSNVDDYVRKQTVLFIFLVCEGLV